MRGGDAKIYVTVSSVYSTTGNFIVTANAQPIAISVTTATEMGGTVANGNIVRVRGFENETGDITATRVEVRSDDDVIVQDNLQAFTPNDSIKILGVSFTVDAGGETEFQDTSDSTIDQTQFSNDAPVGTLVKVKDKEGNSNTPPIGIADEIDIETP